MVTYRCKLCGDTLPSEDWSDEVAIKHLLSIHFELLDGLANGLFDEVREK